MENKSLTQISHEEARRLIHHKADYLLDHNRLSLLNAHLKGCAECSAHASQLNELENILPRVMQNKWKLHPTPILVGQLMSRIRSGPFGFANYNSVARTAAIVIAVVAFMISAWQFSSIKSAAPPQKLIGVLPIPTPSTQLTSTGVTAQDCGHVQYRVQEDDTLQGIAYKFSVSKETIMAFNNMSTETIAEYMEIKIPLCNFTPSRTDKPPTTTITITPQFELNTSTPG